MTPEDFLRENDAALFLADAPTFQVNLEMQGAGAGRLPAKELEELASRVCKYWGHKKKALAKRNDLTYGAWEKISDAIKEFWDDLDGRPKGEALQLLRTRVSINETIMNNVRPSLRIWQGGVVDRLKSANLPDAIA